MAVSALTDEALVAGLKAHVARERESTADVVEHLMEIKERRLYAAAGCTSMTAYTVERLGYSKDEGGRRVTAARLADSFPVILSMLRSGDISLCTLREVGHTLTTDNHLERLKASVGKSRLDLQEMVANLAPKPDVPSQSRFIPDPEAPLFPAQDAPLLSGSFSLPPSSKQVAAPAVELPARPAPLPKPLGGGRYHIQGMVDRETFDDLMWLRDKLRHSIPDGDTAKIFKKALRTLREKVEAQKFGKRKTVPAAQQTLDVEAKPTNDSSADNRRAPGRSTRREVSERDEQRCCFVSDDGHRCSSTAWIEFDHDIRHADGGPTDSKNMRLLCRTHNQWRERVHPTRGGSATASLPR